MALLKDGDKVRFTDADTDAGRNSSLCERLNYEVIYTVGKDSFTDPEDTEVMEYVFLRGFQTQWEAKSFTLVKEVIETSEVIKETEKTKENA